MTSISYETTKLEKKIINDFLGDKSQNNKYPNRNWLTQQIYNFETNTLKSVELLKNSVQFNLAMVTESFSIFFV